MMKNSKQLEITIKLMIKENIGKQNIMKFSNFIMSLKKKNKYYPV